MFNTSPLYAVTYIHKGYYLYITFISTLIYKLKIYNYFTK